MDSLLILTVFFAALAGATCDVLNGWAWIDETGHTKGRCTFGPEYDACSQEKLQELFHEVGGKNMDPLVIDNLDIVEERLNTISQFTNLKVYGFKDVIVTSYFEEINPENKLKYLMKIDLVADGNVNVKFLKTDNILFSGNIKYEGSVTGLISFAYTSKKVNGIDRFELGPEEIVCESQNAKSTLSEELRKAIENEPDVQDLQSEFEKIQTEYRAKVVCEIAKSVFEHAIESNRNMCRQGYLQPVMNTI